MKKGLRLVGINLMVLIGLFVVIELVMRALGLNYGNCPLNRDPELHHVHPKDYSFKSYDIRGEFGDFIVRFDTNGRRIPSGLQQPALDNPKIWFLGDSYTEACQVSWEDSYVGMLEDAVEGVYHTVNYGVSAYSPLMYFVLLKRELRHSLPDKVFIQLCENDFAEEQRFERLASFNDLDQPLLIDGGKASKFLQLARSSYLLKALRRAQLSADFRIKSRRRNKTRGDSGSASLGHEDADFSANSRFVKSIGQIHELLNAMNIEHYFFFIPPKQTVKEGRWNSSVLSTRFNRYAQEQAIPYVDMDSVFRSEAQTRPLFFEEDFHCNSAGHEVIALELSKKIANENKQGKIQ